MLGVVGYDTSLLIKFIDMESTNNFENVISYLNYEDNNMDFDYTCLVNRIVVGDTINTVDNIGLCWFPQSRWNFEDNEFSFEIKTPLQDTSGEHQFPIDLLSTVLIQSLGAYLGYWASIIKFNVYFQGVLTEIRGLFVLSECSIEISDNDVISRYEGNLLQAPVGSYLIS